MKNKNLTLTNEQLSLKYKIIAALYFPVQFFIIRFLILGFSPTPTPEDIARGFNFEQIAAVITDFINNIGEVLTVDHIIFIIFNILPYLVRLAWYLIPAAAFCYVAYTLITFITAQIDIIFHKVSMDNVVSVRVGQPGSGKSSSAGYDAVVLARQMWADVKFKYWSMQKHVKDYIANGDTQKLLEWYEVRECYEYYITRDCVPCLWSNIPLKVGGQYTSILKYEHAVQIEKIPYKSVLYFDEVGSILRQQMSINKVLSASDFCRLCRHFGEYRIIATEQDEVNIYNDFRRVVSENRYMLSQKWVNKPFLFLIPYNYVKKYYSKHENAGYKWISSFMQELNTIIKHIGQRKYKYVNRQNTEMQVKKRERIKTQYLPTMLNYQYNDRTFKNLYLAKNKALQGEIFNSLLISANDDTAKRYLKTADTTKAENWFNED